MIGENKLQIKAQVNTLKIEAIIKSWIFSHPIHAGASFIGHWIYEGILMIKKAAFWTLFPKIKPLYGFIWMAAKNVLFNMSLWHC